MKTHIDKPQNGLLSTGKKTKVIAFVAENLNPETPAKLLTYANEYAHEHRTCTIRFVSDKAPDIFTILSECDGIFADIPGTTYAKLRESVGIPIVCDTVIDIPNAAYVDSDPEKEGVMAAEWFLAHRFANFAFCSVSGEFLALDNIGKSFAKALKNAGFDCITCDPQKLNFAAIKAGRVTITSYLDEWIPHLPPKTAVLCKSDMMASRVIQACQRTGRSVPDDIAVMGIGNSAMICSSGIKAISSIAEDYRLQTYTALRLLEDMIDHPEKAKERPTALIPPLEVIERESTQTYPVNPPWLAKILLLIDENIAKPIALTDLADAAGVSQPTLQNAIRRTFGMSANNYIVSTKMREAMRLVKLGGYSVKEIAARTGFSSQSYFTRAYTAFYGRPPTAEIAQPQGRRQ